MNALDGERLNRKENFRTPTQSVEYTWKEILLTNFNENISKLEERLAVETTLTNIVLLKDLISVYTRARAKKNELISTQPDLVKIPAQEISIYNSIDSNFFTATAIGTEKRKLYSALYKSSESGALNPCRDFRL